MNEADWLAGSDPTPMLEFLRDNASDRKLRLFAVSLAREVSDPAFDRVLVTALEAAELLADGRLPQEQQDHVTALLNATARRLTSDHGQAVRDWPKDVLEAWLLTTNAYHPPSIHWLREPTRLPYMVISKPNLSRQPRLLREAFGNPFRPVAFDPVWRTSTILALATGIYEDRAFDRLPILADALEEAGCDSADLLAHCRDDGEHVRGCWAVDLVLGKE